MTNIGEVIVDEPAYCTSLMPNQWKTRCHNCCKKTDVPVPCPTCAMVVFCSERCREKALEEGHEAECPMMGNIAEAEKSRLGSLATRMVMKAGLKTMLRQVL